MKNRRASCTPKNNLNFDWQPIKAPMRVIEYVIAHGLTRLLESNHIADFLAVVKNQPPDRLKSKEWLKRACSRNARNHLAPAGRLLTAPSPHANLGKPISCSISDALP